MYIFMLEDHWYLIIVVLIYNSYSARMTIRYS